MQGQMARCRSLMTCRLSKLISTVFVESHRAVKSGEINELVEKGGRGSAKSSFLSLELVLELLKHPECHAVIMRKVANTLRTSVYAQICWAIAALGLSDKFKCTVSPMECTYLKTGQKILFFGMDDPGKLKSIKVPFGYIGLAWFEELDQFDGPDRSATWSSLCFEAGPIPSALNLSTRRPWPGTGRISTCWSQRRAAWSIIAPILLRRRSGWGLDS